MLEVVKTKSFMKDFKDVIKSSKKSVANRINKRLQFAIQELSEQRPLPKDYYDHKLNDNKLFDGYRDCHILGDLVLLYKIDGKQLELILLRIGSHSKLGLTEILLNV